MSLRIELGFELVQGPQGHSFKLLRKAPGQNKPSVIPSMSCPIWFPNKLAAKACARELISKVKEQLKKGNIVAETHET